MPFLHDFREFAMLLAGIYAAHLLAYFAFGFGLSWLNRRNPARRIQPHRDGDRRRAVEIRHSLVSTLVTSLSLAIGLFVQDRGWVLFPPVELTWWNALPLFGVTLVLFDAWFYTAHRLMHTRLLYPWHKLHHQSVAPTPWSTFSDRALDTLFHQGFYAVVPFFLPIPGVVLVANRVLDHISGTIGHGGFEYFAGPTARRPWPLLCVTYHDQHHSAFRYNFANYFSWLDRLFGTIHPNYDSAVAEAENAPPVRLTAAGDDRQRPRTPSSA